MPSSRAVEHIPSRERLVAGLLCALAALGAASWLWVGASHVAAPAHHHPLRTPVAAAAVAASAGPARGEQPIAPVHHQAVARLVRLSPAAQWVAASRSAERVDAIRTRGPPAMV